MKRGHKYNSFFSNNSYKVVVTIFLSSIILFQNTILTLLDLTPSHEGEREEFGSRQVCKNTHTRSLRT